MRFAEVASQVQIRAVPNDPLDEFDIIHLQRARMADLEEQLQTFYQEIEDKNDLIRELKLELYMTNKPMIP